VILPNFGRDSSPQRIRRFAEAAEQLGLDSVWTTEHIVVGPAGNDPYGSVYGSLVTLGWIAGWTERVGLDTSIALVPLHNPFHLAKQAATLQELSAGRFTLGVGVGWHRDEYEFMGVEFEGRGRRADEASRLMRAAEQKGPVRAPLLVIPGRDRRAAPDPAAADLGRWQLAASDPASARTRRRLAPIPRLRPRTRTQRQGTTPTCARFRA